MNEEEDFAKDELRRIDHLVFVTLKYTRTVDIIRTILGKLVTTIDYKVEDYTNWLYAKEKIPEIPPAPLMRIKKIEQLHKQDSTIKDMVDFYVMLKRVNTAEFRAKEEYRKNVTLVTKEHEVNINMLKDYAETVKKYVEYLDKLKK